MIDQSSLEAHARAALRTLAGPTASPEEARRAARGATAAARRRRQHTSIVLIAATVVAVAVGASTVGMLGSDSSVTTPASATEASIGGWPARGNEIGNQGLVDGALDVWRSEAPGNLKPGQEVTTLYAGTRPAGMTGAGTTVVMLVSQTNNGNVVGVLSTAQDLSNSALPQRGLILRSVVTVSAAEHVRSVGFVADAMPSDHPHELAGSLGYVLLAPGIDAGEVRSSMVDADMRDSGDLPAAVDGLIGFIGLAGSGPWNSWVALPDETPGVDLLGGAVGAPGYVSGELDGTGAVTTDGDGTSPQVGDLVVARDNRPAGNGLLGVVTRVAGDEGYIDSSLAGLERWNVQATSLNGEYSGTLSRDDSGQLLFSTNPVETPNGVSRVVASTADGSVTVNVGYFTPRSPGEANTRSPFPITPVDTAPDTGSLAVWIIATGAQE